MLKGTISYISKQVQKQVAHQNQVKHHKLIKKRKQVKKNQKKLSLMVTPETKIKV